MKPFEFAPWSKNILAPDEDWRRAAEAPLVEVTCDLWGDPIELYSLVGMPLYSYRDENASAIDGSQRYTSFHTRRPLFELIDRSPNHWWLTTQQPGRVEKGWPPAGQPSPFFSGPYEAAKFGGKKRYSNVTLFIPAQTQAELDRLAPELFRLRHLCKIGLDLRQPRERLDVCETLGIWWNQTSKQWEHSREPVFSTVRLAACDDEPCECGHEAKYHATSKPGGEFRCFKNIGQFYCDCLSYRPAYTTHLASQCQAAGATIAD